MSKTCPRYVQDGVIRNVVENTGSLTDCLSVSNRTVSRALAVLQSKGLIEHKGSTKKGYWEVIVPVK